MNDQRSTTDQLRDAVDILNREGLYDAADFCKAAVGRVDEKLRANAAAEQAEIAAGWCQEPVWDGPHVMICGRGLVLGECGSHGKQEQ